MEIDELVEKITRLNYPNYDKAIEEIRNAILKRRNKTKEMIEEYVRDILKNILIDVKEIINYKCQGCLSDTGGCTCLEDKTEMLIKLKNDIEKYINGDINDK